MSTHEIVRHIDRETFKRPKQKTYTFSFDSKPRYYRYVEYELSLTLKEIADDLYRRNAKANRLFKYKIVDGKILWKLHYPTIKRTATGYIKPRKEGKSNVKSN
ncbi:MAG: hypothetical protein VW577_06380 [Pelagibacteraceae bacterium]